MTAPSKATRRKRARLGRRAAASLAELYREERAVWNAHYKRYFKIAARVLGLGFVAGFAFFLLWPNQEKKAFAYLLRSLGDIPLGAPPLVLALTLFYHNARASLLAVAAGGLPFLCLPVLDPFVNGAALGLLASISKHQGLDVPLLFLKSVVPHGLFELPAVLYATSAGLYLSVSLGKEVRAAARRRRAPENARTCPRRMWACPPDIPPLYRAGRQVIPPRRPAAPPRRGARRGVHHPHAALRCP